MLTTVWHNHLYHLRTEEELLAAFREKDRKHVILPRGFEFPLDIRYFFSWTESSGSYTYLIYKRPNWESPRGMVFRRGPPAANMCDWCHSYGSGDEVSMLTVRVNPRLTLGQYLCSDLSCQKKLEIQVSATGKSFEALCEQLCEKINRFYEKSIMAPSTTVIVDDEE